MKLIIDIPDNAPLDRKIKYMLMNCPEYGLMDGYVILGL